MSWSKLAPIVKTTGRPMASASIVVNKDGVPKVALILSASLKDEFGAAVRADISAGEGEHEGCLLVEFAADGPFEMKGFVHGGGRFFVPIGPGVPDKATANHPCVLKDKTASSFVVELPVAAWRVEIAARRVQKPARAESPPPVPAAPAPVVNGARVDAVEYLRNKGRKAEWLAAGRFQVDGEVLQIGQVLKLVNDHRKAADLDPLPIAKIW